MSKSVEPWKPWCDCTDPDCPTRAAMAERGRLHRVAEEVRKEVASWPTDLRERLFRELRTKSYAGAPPRRTDK